MEKQPNQCSFLKSKDERIEVSQDESNYDARRLHFLNAIPYSEREIKALAERLCNKETFKEALQVLISWLVDGQCNERNSVHFYSCIQLCWNHMEKLIFERKEYFKESQKAQESSQNKICCVQLKLNEIGRVFKMIENKDILNNFSQNQIEKIHEMRTDILDLKKNFLDGSVGMEVEEGESSGMDNEDVRTENVAYKQQTTAVSLIYGLNTVNQKSEVSKTSCQERQNEILEVKSKLENDQISQEKNSSPIDAKQQKNSDVASQCNLDQAHENEMHVISLVSVILCDYPDGVNIDFIYSRLKSSTIISITSARELEEIMRKYPTVFIESSPTEAIQEKKWIPAIKFQELFNDSWLPSS